MVKGLSIVIPNYNGLSLFPHTLPTIYHAVSSLSCPYEIIVVDDCSTDGSISFLQQYHPSIKILSNETNLGFSRTVNKGVGQAQFELVLLLNSDVQLTPGYIEPQLKYFDLPNTFGVMGRIIGWDDEIIQDGAKYPYFHGVKIKTSGNYLMESPSDAKESLLTMYLSGANALISKNVFLEIGGLQEMFSPFYIEDYELSLRAWRLGYKCYYEHNAICRHKTSTTIRSSSKKKWIETIYNRNKFFLHGIHLATTERYLYYLSLIPELFIRVITGRWSYLGSLVQFMQQYGGVRQSRKNLKITAGNKELLPVRAVAQVILSSIKEKKIRRF